MTRTLAAVVALALSSSALHAETFTADVWADNWFEMRVDGTQVAEDSVPITTERSFNAERFAFEAERPFTLGLVAKDFQENDTGLEYVGTRRQQMGDGGVIAQIANEAGETVIVTDADWQCLVIHRAPLDKTCEGASDPVAGEGACGFEASGEPEGWDEPGFDASDWSQATIHDDAAVDPKMGYDEVEWSDAARFVWGPDIEQDNTVLCRLTVE